LVQAIQNTLRADLFAAYANFAAGTWLACIVGLWRYDVVLGDWLSLFNLKECCLFRRAKAGAPPKMAKTI
jgi:hypothetical protein